MANGHYHVNTDQNDPIGVNYGYNAEKVDWSESSRRRRLGSAARTSSLASDMQNFRYDDQHLVIDKANNVVWTKRDQLKLQQVDELCIRMMEHHNNVHTRTVTVDACDSIIESSRQFDPDLLERMSVLGKSAGESEQVMVAVSFKSSNYREKKLKLPVRMTEEEGRLYLALLDFDDPVWNSDDRKSAQEWQNSQK